MSTTPPPQPGSAPSPGPQPVTPPPTGAGPEPVRPGTEHRRLDEATSRTRISSTYVAVGVGVVLLILVIIFIVQNLSDAKFSYLGAHFRLPVGVLMLIAFVAGGLVVLLVSLARVFQLRVRARRARHEAPGRVS